METDDPRGTATISVARIPEDLGIAEILAVREVRGTDFKGGRVVVASDGEDLKDPDGTLILPDPDRHPITGVQAMVQVATLAEKIANSRRGMGNFGPTDKMEDSGPTGWMEGFGLTGGMVNFNPIGATEGFARGGMADFNHSGGSS
jgi:hypothetical protein